MHYERWRATGDPLAVRPRWHPHRLPDDEAAACMRAAGIEPLEPYPGTQHPWPGTCLTCGTEVAPKLANIRSGRGGCKHCAVAKNAGPTHYKWNGGSTGYESAHQRIKRQRGKAADHLCVECGQAAAQWAYDHSDPDERLCTVKGQELAYSTDVERYQPMCYLCHKAFDGAHAKAS